ncbi:Uncharacterised protein [Tsukamurella paurometabola]|uniref:Uncharacterized protein n=1 Tax=Tsukamurella paurometabola TaxID=2061 RepID=A0A3P8K3U1_TSUPA|nr:Uncharacterised protein [Tsukamurella paurometabola]
MNPGAIRRVVRRFLPRIANEAYRVAQVTRIG